MKLHKPVSASVPVIFSAGLCNAFTGSIMLSSSINNSMEGVCHGPAARLCSSVSLVLFLDLPSSHDAHVTAHLAGFCLFQTDVMMDNTH